MAELNISNSPYERAILRKIDLHFLPTLCWLSVVTSLLATNIGNARVLGLLEELHLSDNDFSLALVVFFIPCIFLGAPGNLVMNWLSHPPYYLCSLVFVWGIIMLASGFTQTYGGLIASRVLGGACDAGFNAGAIYWIARYYPRNVLHTRMSLFLASRLLASAFGGLLGYALGQLAGHAGYAGWRWLFVIEGAITCVSALGAVFLLPGWLANAKFLNAEEKQALTHRITTTSCGDSDGLTGMRLVRRVALDPKVYFTSTIHFCCAATIVSSSYFLPTILNELGWEALQAQYLTIPIFLTAFVCAILNGLTSDYFRFRYPFCVWPLLFSVIAFSIMLAGSATSPSVHYFACFLSTIGSFAAQSIAITWLSNNIYDNKQRAISLGVAAGIGNCGTILGCNIFLQIEAPYYPTGFGTCLGLICWAIVAASAHLWYLVRCNGRQKARDVEMERYRGESPSSSSSYALWNYIY